MNCPLCGGKCQDRVKSNNNAIKFNCQKYNRSFAVGASVDIQNNEMNQRKLNNLIFEHMIRAHYADDVENLWWFYYSPDYASDEEDDYYRINLAEIPYPINISEKIDRILLNLYYINSSFGYRFMVHSAIYSALFIETRVEEQTFGICSLMVELEYILPEGDRYYRIAAKGWQRIDELLRNEQTKRQAFIAMAFRDETKAISDAIKTGIREAGYEPLRIDEKEHNNQIVPEILYQIDNSKFLVMDITVPNNGAYYEAGYALGKGKQVIICCSKESFESESENQPHFDVAQKSMIVWKNEADLVERLKKRIKATVDRK